MSNPPTGRLCLSGENSVVPKARSEDVAIATLELISRTQGSVESSKELVSSTLPLSYPPQSARPSSPRLPTGIIDEPSTPNIWNLIPYNVPWGSAYRDYVPGSLPGPEGPCIFLRSPTPLKNRRVAKACARCRERKAKCSGTYPACTRCISRGYLCQYTADEPKRAKGPCLFRERQRAASSSDCSSASGDACSVTSSSDVSDYTSLVQPLPSKIEFMDVEVDGVPECLDLSAVSDEWELHCPVWPEAFLHSTTSLCLDQSPHSLPQLDDHPTGLQPEQSHAISTDNASVALTVHAPQPTTIASSALLTSPLNCASPALNVDLRHLLTQQITPMEVASFRSTYPHSPGFAHRGALDVYGKYHQDENIQPASMYG
ncbi:uncharacterized protein FIBRA_02489 [Fibroporia radiculosa]|uniref:Zn(2)-C6 fungal-type domain-containing protein n=1 Tax=Fibroporia radiculosa TaxID=599839 RepID=J4I932_9APHY|nr:uncharacterized protein FIBRA_02489 [Fibroporia radiculosa]CCM00456.1 predicted protein [Fibroporia radiculosa]